MRRLLALALDGGAGRPLLASLIVFALCGPAAAQTSPPAEEPAPARIGPVLFTGYIQYDYRATGVEDDEESEDQFYPRRVRFLLSGPLASGIKWAISAETTGRPALRDAFITLDYLPAATVRIGQMVLPYGYERFVISSNTMEFTERVLADLAPGRDAGIMVSNERPFFGWFSYGAAIYNGTGQNIPDNNDAKDALLRVAAAPPRLRGLAIGANVARGEQPEGMRSRIGGDVVYETRDYHLGTEFLRERTRDGQQTQNGFYGFGSWRYYPDAVVRGFDHLELAARYTRLRGPVATEQWDLVVNYYVHRGLRFMLDVTLPKGAGADVPGTGVHARANLRF